MQAEIIRKIQMGAIYVVFFSLFLMLPTYSWLDYDSVRPQCVKALREDDAKQFEHHLQTLTKKFTPTFESRQLKARGIISIIRIFNDILEFAVSENTVKIFYYFLTNGPGFHFSCQHEFDFFLGQALTQGYNHKSLCWFASGCVDGGPDYEEPISAEKCRPWIIRAIEQRNVHCLNVFLHGRIFEDNQNYTPAEALQRYIDYLNKCLSTISQDDVEMQSVFINILQSL